MTPRRRALLVAAAFPALAGLSLAAWIAWPLPEGLVERPGSLGITLLDRHGLELRTSRAGDGSRAGWMTLDEMDPQLIQAFVAMEDRRFFSHRGVDPLAVGRAALQGVRSGRAVSGASTITMQLARLLRRGGHGPAAKLGQTLWALRLELHLTKHQILEQYLNRVPLGQGAVGVPAAADLYFASSAARLSLGQAALLAGLASAPSANNPHVSGPGARARRARALERMEAVGFTTAQHARRANSEPLVPGNGSSPFHAPHFTSVLLRRLADSSGAITGRIATSIDLELQRALEAEVLSTVLLRDMEVRHGAAVVLDNETGEILAWVGSPDFHADTAGQVDMVVSPRQPGSTLKPFLYALALDRGWTAASVLADIPRAYHTVRGPYQPRNYDRLFHGPVRVREALASSFNVPAVELTSRLGPAGLLGVLREAGFHSLDRGADWYGLGLSLGNGDVRLLELANAYRGLARGGEWRPVRWTAGGGAPAAGRRFASRGAAWLVLDVLADADARVPGFGVDTAFDFPFRAAVKTGTSRNYTDNWAVAVTGGFTVAVWVGNFSGRPMRRVSGVTGAGPLLRRAVLRVAERYDPGVLPVPAAAGAVRARVCRLSGHRAGERCPGIEEWFLPGTEPERDCNWHRADGGIAWPAEYADWVAQNWAEDGGRRREVGGAALSASAAGLQIVSPRDGDRYQIPPGMDSRYATVALRAAGEPGDEPLAWYVDGRPLEAGRWRLEAGRHVIRAVGASGRTAEARVVVR